MIFNIMIMVIITLYLNYAKSKNMNLCKIIQLFLNFYNELILLIKLEYFRSIFSYNTAILYNLEQFLLKKIRDRTILESIFLLLLICFSKAQNANQ